MKSNKKQAENTNVLSSGEKQRKKQILKKVSIAVFVLLVILLAVLFVLKLVSDKVSEDGSYIKQLSEVYPTYTPFPAEWNTVLSEDTDYLSLNTNIMYGTGESGSLYSLEDFYTSYKHEGQKFFAEYFRILREGDYEKYSSLFTEEYKKIPTQHRFEKNIDRVFPPQRVYDITVREIGRFNDDKKDVVYGVYYVDYKIDRNNNLFRSDIGYNSDIGSDTSRPLFFEIVTHNPGTEKEKTLIGNMYTESSMKANAQNK